MFKFVEPKAVQQFIQKSTGMNLPIVYGQKLADLPPIHSEPFLWVVLEQAQDEHNFAYSMEAKHLRNAESKLLHLEIFCSTHPESRQINAWKLIIEGFDNQYKREALRLFDYTQTGFYPSHLFELDIRYNGQPCFI